MKIATVIGARPQFIKVAPESRALRQKYQEILIHTGQHYSANMSDVFFSEMDIPIPDCNLEAGSGHHGTHIGIMLKRKGEVLLKENLIFF
jgi:UDP-N-acetylglucosamine 2-epimerase